MASVPPSLMNFTKECLTQGIARTEIRQALIDAGWTDRVATAALESFAESPLPVPVPKKRVSSGPRAAFLHLLAPSFYIWLPSQLGPFSFWPLISL